MSNTKWTLSLLILSAPLCLTAQGADTPTTEEGTPDKAASVIGEPVHPHARWQTGDTYAPWSYPPYPGPWSAPSPGPYGQNPYPPGRWQNPPPPPAQSGYPPAQWYATPQYPPYGNPYPPGNWSQQPQNSPWGTQPSYPYWGPGYRNREWEYPYPPQLWYGQ